MGLFDNVRCRYQIPWPEAADFFWQTKSPAAPFSENWEIKADGTLWKEECDYEDRSDPKAEGLLGMCGMMTPVSQRWVKQDYWNGEFEIHELVDEPTKPKCWYSVLFWFRDGVVKDAIFEKREGE